MLACSNEKVGPDVVKLSVDFTWEGIKPCNWGNPQIYIEKLPERTKFIKISMYDHAYKHDHGTVVSVFDGNGVISRNAFNDIQGPCPLGTPGRYEITVKALDEQQVVIGIGSKERAFPES